MIRRIDNVEVQKKQLDRAHKALRPGGHLPIDFDCPDPLRFAGLDGRGNNGCCIVLNSPSTSGRASQRYELAPRDGEPFTVVQEVSKHFPAPEQMCAMLYLPDLPLSSCTATTTAMPLTPGSAAA